MGEKEETLDKILKFLRWWVQNRPKPFLEFVRRLQKVEIGKIPATQIEHPTMPKRLDWRERLSYVS